MPAHFKSHKRCENAGCMGRIFFFEKGVWIWMKIWISAIRMRNNHLSVMMVNHLLWGQLMPKMIHRWCSRCIFIYHAGLWQWCFLASRSYVPNSIQGAHPSKIEGLSRQSSGFLEQAKVVVHDLDDMEDLLAHADRPNMFIACVLVGWARSVGLVCLHSTASMPIYSMQTAKAGQDPEGAACLALVWLSYWSKPARATWG